MKFHEFAVLGFSDCHYGTKLKGQGLCIDETLPYGPYPVRYQFYINPEMIEEVYDLIEQDGHDYRPIESSDAF